MATFLTAAVRTSGATQYCTVHVSPLHILQLRPLAKSNVNVLAVSGPGKPI
jgi:hypothetical protein